MRPPGDRLRRAVERLEAERAARPDASLPHLVDEVARELDLNAAEAEWLLRLTLETRRSGGGAE